jgi:hypothetical protein
MFLKPSEHIIIMDDAPLISFSLDDLRKLEDAGIETVMLPHALYWGSNADKQLELVLQTSLKSIIPFFYGLSFQEYPNYADEGFCKSIDDFCYSTLEYYESLRSRVQFIFAIPNGGEFLWDAFKIDNFPVSDGIIAKFIIDRQKILIQQHGEIWMCLHHFLGHPKNWNNTHILNVYRAIRDEFPAAPFYSIQFAHFAVGNTPIVEPTLFAKTTLYKELFDLKVFVGSEYCEGLKTNYDKLIQQNLWGFITSPLQSFNMAKPKSIEPWMVEVIRDTNKKLNGAYHETDN